MPVNQMILKVASRCNLNCSYCYMYNAGDMSFLKQPKVMSSEVIRSILLKVRNYCHHHGLQEFDFVFHGGEPLLTGPQFWIDFIAAADELLGPSIIYSISVQTNGILVDEAWSLFFKENNIYTGVSLDGPEIVNDAHRKYHSGKGSFKDVVKGIAEIKKYNDLNIISVIDTKANVSDIYELIKNLGTVRYVTQIPYANHDKPPEINSHSESLSETPIADWLIDLYDIWRKDAKPKPTITFFSQIISLILGNKNIGSDMLGESDGSLIIVETDGGIEPSSSLKICGDSFTKQGLNILNVELEDALDNSLISAYLSSHNSMLPAKCQRCLVKEVCGGGPLSSRYKTGSKFDNPSVYCKDLMKLITYIQNSILDVFPLNSPVHLKVSRLSYLEVRESIEEYVA